MLCPLPSNRWIISRHSAAGRGALNVIEWHYARAPSLSRRCSPDGYNGQDFASHIEKTVATDPAARWIFIVDNLSTHTCEALVRLVASLEEESIDVGEMKKRGVLMSLASRRAFLTDPARKVRFVFTPKHCSWLNQIEMWFSILARRVLRRGSFKSTAELEAAVVAFIDYFNSVLAKPFRWTYTGRALTA